ncbi:hypothetical protein [Bacillus pumilus]|uniref:hypothetical protein n=1 Tax=Bacillus pumilus TaxID=1408 RepID=UPI0011A2EE58|nr:hypothetical protein [Bacillus pumilus]
MSKRMYANFRAMIFNNDTNTFSLQRVKQVAGDTLETEDDILPLGDARKVINEEDGQVFYLYHYDNHTKVESENLKRLRRSVALRGIFNYDTAKKLDIMTLLPWLVIVLLVLFK